ADDEIVASGAGAVRSRPPFAAGRPEMLGVAEIDERVEAGHRFEDDVAALAAIAAVGAAIFDIFLKPEADRTRPARARADEYLCLIEKMHRAPLYEYAAKRTLGPLPSSPLPAGKIKSPAAHHPQLMRDGRPRRLTRDTERLGDRTADHAVAKRG